MICQQNFKRRSLFLWVAFSLFTFFSYARGTGTEDRRQWAVSMASSRCKQYRDTGNIGYTCTKKHRFNNERGKKTIAGGMLTAANGKFNMPTY